MKTILGLLIFIVVFSIQIEPLQASTYQSYQEITFDRQGKKLLRDFSDFDYIRLYDQLKGRRFWGWRTTTHMKNEPVTFTKETLYRIENDGTTPIMQSYSFKTTEQKTKQVSASGSIAIDLSGDISRFKAGLDSEIETGFEIETKTTLEEVINIDIEIDPMTALHIAIYGEGRISNGVGRQYRFFRNVREGGWEVFTLTTEYYAIIKERLHD